jgi:hypothetical protein
MRWLVVGFIVVVALAAGWLLRDRWLDGGARSDVAAGPAWEPLTAEGAARARTAIGGLGSRGGPVFASLRPGDLAAYIFEELAKQLPPSAENIRAAVIGERVHIKASVKLSELGGASTLGPLAGLLSERDTVRFGGAFEVIRPGLAQYRVRELHVGNLALPAPLIPRVIRQVRRGAVPEGVTDDGLALTIPEYIADVRIGDGKVTVYKNAP